MDDRLRVSDADRDGAVALLRAHFAAGRLAARELDERLTAAVSARTFGDLRPVLADLPDAGQALHHASFRPDQSGSLARRYRRLLGCYPGWYRRIHEDEMLAVLMTDAPPGKRRPGSTEAADLILGALRIRCQPSLASGAEPAWRDALAVLSVLVPLIVVLTTTGTLIRAYLTLSAGESIGGIPETLALVLILTGLVLLALRMRRLAALGAAGLLIWLVSDQFSYGVALVMAGAFGFLALGLEILALAASRGPRRGLQILTWKHWAFAVIATVLAGGVIPMPQPVYLALVAALSAGMALASSLGRWLLLWLAVTCYPVLARVVMDVGYERPSAAHIAALYLPSLALLVLALTAARRMSVRRA